MKRNIKFYCLTLSCLQGLLLISVNFSFGQNLRGYYSIIERRSQTYNNYVRNSYNKSSSELIKDNEFEIRLETDLIGENATNKSTSFNSLSKSITSQNNYSRSTVQNIRALFFYKPFQTFNLNQRSIQYIYRSQGLSKNSAFPLEAFSHGNSNRFFNYRMLNNTVHPLYNAALRNNNLNNYERIRNYMLSNSITSFRNNYFGQTSHSNTFSRDANYYQLGIHSSNGFHAQPLYGRDQLDFLMNLYDFKRNSVEFSSDLIRRYSNPGGLAFQGYQIMLDIFQFREDYFDRLSINRGYSSNFASNFLDASGYALRNYALGELQMKLFELVKETGFRALDNKWSQATYHLEVRFRQIGGQY